MSFRVKLRIKSVNSCYPRPFAPASPKIPDSPKTDPKLLRDLYEAAKDMRPIGEGPWTRRWAETPAGTPDSRFAPNFRSAADVTFRYSHNVSSAKAVQ